MANVVPATVATLAPFVKVNCTDDARPGDAALGVLDAMTTTAVASLCEVHEVASLPMLGFAPTFAVHANPGMKFAPVTVMVLPAYAADGAIEAAVGLLLMTKILAVVI